ncbi:major facilitator superfamily domain-containing protein 4A-like isoform X2 [Eriocheir sinensis]|uniref:major facilitator superfamily domain-containing protein 4A-like isoform X2 n=1 Tax=Eriocheir sinensis TaxID=95602 RepID=UPI0021C5904A|nr:major facilitator superfamily domain-containing protein 4A-like isoform X2 [Eriocheir sinensis]
MVMEATNGGVPGGGGGGGGGGGAGRMVGSGVLGHAKELCVNKMGHTMVPRPESGGGFAKFRGLFWRHRLQTVTYCAVFWSFGMCVAFLGPTLLDLGCRISSVFSSMSWIFFSQALFTLIGSACGGFLIQRNRGSHLVTRGRRCEWFQRWFRSESRLGNHVVLLVSTSMLAVTLAIVPWCRVLWGLAGVLAVMGFFMGTVDTVANISMIQLYGRNVAPFLQTLHFFYGLGAFLSPIIAEPFLLNKDCDPEPPMPHPRNLTLPLPPINATTTGDSSGIQYAFWILSGLQVPVILLLILLVAKEAMGLDIGGEAEVGAEGAAGAGAGVEGGKEAYEMQGKGEGAVELPPVTREQMLTVTILTAFMLFLYDGLQAGYGGYVFSYAVRSIAGMSMDEAAYLNACFWGTFAFGRLISIALATRLAPSFMLLCNISGCLFAMVLMLSLRHNHAVLYIGTCIFGTFLSSVYPTAVSLAETYIHVTSSMTSALVVTAAAGEMVVPVIIGHAFESIGPASLLISGVVMTLLSFVVYLVLCLVAQTITRHSFDVIASLDSYWSRVCDVIVSLASHWLRRRDVRRRKGWRGRDWSAPFCCCCCY